MASDVDDLTTFYASLPSIFEDNPLTPGEPIRDIPASVVETDKTYQSMFGSFLFAGSEPLTRAAFVASALPSIDIEATHEQLIDDDVSLTKITTTDTLTSPPPLAPEEELSDMDDNQYEEEDDFDGIPIRHATNIMKTKLNGDSDSAVSHSEHNHFLDQLVRRIDMNGNHMNNDDDDDEDAFLNGFTDDQQQESIVGPSLFKNIPDIDDPNEHEEEDDDGIPFDRMDLLDQSDSIRSSSPDSLLSSSHLRDDDDDDDDNVIEMNKIDDNDDDDDDDVTQWNDDFLLGKANFQHDRPNAPSPPLQLLAMHPHDQVDFIDSSRSESRCSHASSHLSNGYTDQGRIFLHDDELLTSSDSDDENYHPETHDERVTIDYDTFDRDRSEELSLQVNIDQSRSRSLSHSSFNSRSSSPIPDQSPIIAIDDDIDETNSLPTAPIARVDDDDDLHIDQSNQPVLSNSPWKNIIESNIDRRRNELVRDIVDIREIYRTHENDDEFIAVMHNPRIFEQVLNDIDDQQALSPVKRVNTPVDASWTTSQLPDDNILPSESLEHCRNVPQTSLSRSNEEKKNNGPSSISPCAVAATTTNTLSGTVVNHPTVREKRNESAVDTSKIEQKKGEAQLLKTSTINRHIAQITHGEQDQRMSSDDESENDSELLNTLAQFHGLVQSPRTSLIRQHDEEHRVTIENLLSNSDRFEKKKTIFYHDLDKTTKMYPNKTGNSFSLTSSTSSIQFTDDELQFNDINRDRQTSSSLIMSTNEFNTTFLHSNPFESDQSDSLLKATNHADIDDLWNKSVTDTDLSDNLNRKSPSDDDENRTDPFKQLNTTPPSETRSLSSSTSEITLIVEQLVSNTVQLALTEVKEYAQQAEQLVNQILTEAIYEIYTEDTNFFGIEQNENSVTKPLIAIATVRDQQFDNLWSQPFSTHDDANLFTAETATNIDPWFTTLITPDHNIESNSAVQSLPPLLLIDMSDFAMTTNDPMKSCLTAFVKANRSVSLDYTIPKTEPSATSNENIDKHSSPSHVTLSSVNDDVIRAASPDDINDSNSSYTDDDDDDDDDDTNKGDNPFSGQSRQSHFEVFASDQPLDTPGIDSITAGIDMEFDRSFDMQKPALSSITPGEQQRKTNELTGALDAPWELDESGEERTANASGTSLKKNQFHNDFSPDPQPGLLSSPSHAISDSDDDKENNEQENYDAYFSNTQLPTKEEKTIDSPLSKSVRFDENIEQVSVLTPKDSLDVSLSSTTTDPDKIDIDDDDEIVNTLHTVRDRITDHMNDDDEPIDVRMRKITPRPDSEISLTESEDLPPPLPPLPPLHTTKKTSIENIPVKSTSSLSYTDSKHKTNLRSESDTRTTTDVKLQNLPDSQLVRSYESAILRSTSTDNTSVDPDDAADVISCLIGNNPINIDAKTISPFKCVIGSAGRLHEDQQTAVITIYGCWLPDHRLREYRYIMDQLFYYVYHKIETLVTDNYILVYFHGATPKHRTPDLKFLRKCYQMINFRLRKNLQAVYVIHPTRWLRTVIAFSRPFFSKKFYRKVHYLYTIAELERQFPHNPLSIPVIIEQTDWLYSQKYDRQNASIKRSIERSLVRSTNGIEQESAA